MTTTPNSCFIALATVHPHAPVPELLNNHYTTNTRALSVFTCSNLAIAACGGGGRMTTRRRYIPTDWDDSLPYGGKVSLARRKLPDSWLCIALQITTQERRIFTSGAAGGDMKGHVPPHWPWLPQSV
ncbi:hypothetical protein GWK47_004106 [Chionoecetes opilio]|uniref:Uncharacterized protein n=1 Tax=Chionoecetes opilio TaxID=41210 RepID=A0A8J4YN67_CHIOP|nr:hypothetical protein GWK47_004106 [Chionoecetes opilio]